VPSFVSRARAGATPRGWVSASMAALLCAACGPSSSASTQKCEYTTNDKWPTGVDLYVNNPASCPLMVPQGGRYHSYSSTTAMPGGQPNASLSFTNAVGGGVGATQQVTYISPGVYGFYGTYLAGSVDGSTGADHAIQSITRDVLGYTATARADVALTYQRSAPASVLVPTVLSPGESTVITGEYYDATLVPPVSYQWFQDGAAVTGPTDDPQLTVHGPVGYTTNTYQNFEFRVVDSQGRSVSGYGQVMTTPTCPDGQSPCNEY